jgi:RNA-directed DNA polymerase
MLRAHDKRPGFGRCVADQRRWPNAYFAEHGLFTMKEAYANAS